MILISDCKVTNFNSIIPNFSLHLSLKMRQKAKFFNEQSVISPQEPAITPCGAPPTLLEMPRNGIYLSAWANARRSSEISGPTTWKYLIWDD